MVDCEEIGAVEGTVKEWCNALVDPDTGTPIRAEGPWLHEPTKMQWVDALTKLPCLIVRGPLANLCGYAGAFPGHPLHGRDYERINVRVHGGLTYAGKCKHSPDPSRGICHVPEPGTSDDVWWFGFDCAHLGDLVPAMIPYSYREIERGEYRDVGYVALQVRMLAAQLACHVAG